MRSFRPKDLIANRIAKLGFLTAVFALSVAGISARGEAGKYTTIEKLTQDIFDTCTLAKNITTCYEEKVPLLLSKLSVQDTLKVTTQLMVKNDAFRYCHIVGHNIGAQAVKNDPNNWKEVLSACSTEGCANGCLHGAFFEKFKGRTYSDREISQLVPDLQVICQNRSNWDPTIRQQELCYHALGHVVMYLTSAAVEPSLKLCRQISQPQAPGGTDHSEHCLDGIFMQIYQPLNSEDIALIKGHEINSPDEAGVFCSKFEGVDKSSCLMDSWPLSVDSLRGQGGVIAFCRQQTVEYFDRCFQWTVYHLARQFNFDQEKILSYCTSLAGDLRGRCIYFSVEPMIDTDSRDIGRAINFCQATVEPTNSNQCWRGLVRGAKRSFNAGAERNQLCGLLPINWKSACLSGDAERNEY